MYLPPMRAKRRPARQLSGYGPAWYQQLGGVVSQPPGRRLPRRLPALGSLGADDPPGSTLSNPTVNDRQWQDDVLSRLNAGVATMRMAETQKWLQIAATLSIPLAAAVWRVIFKKGSDSTV